MLRVFFPDEIVYFWGMQLLQLPRWASRHQQTFTTWSIDCRLRSLWKVKINFHLYTRSNKARSTYIYTYILGQTKGPYASLSGSFLVKRLFICLFFVHSHCPASFFFPSSSCDSRLPDASQQSSRVLLQTRIMWAMLSDSASSLLLCNCLFPLYGHK